MQNACLSLTACHKPCSNNSPGEPNTKVRVALTCNKAGMAESSVYGTTREEPALATASRTEPKAPLRKRSVRSYKFTTSTRGDKQADRERERERHDGKSKAHARSTSTTTRTALNDLYLRSKINDNELSWSSVDQTQNDTLKHNKATMHTNVEQHHGPEDKGCSAMGVDHHQSPMNQSLACA
jgi:hypothetical protein